MFSYLQKQNNKKILGVEFCDDGIRYALVEFGRDINVLYKGTELPAFSFDGVALAVENILEYSLPIRNVSDKEMLFLLQNEMQVSWGKKPDEYQVTWHRPKDNHDVSVGLLKKEMFFEYLQYAKNMGTELLAVVPARRKNFTDDEDLYAIAIHAACVAGGTAKDLNFTDFLKKEQQQQSVACRYLTAAKAVVILGGIIFICLLTLLAFSCYKIYVVTEGLNGIQNLQKQYDLYLSKSRQIRMLQGIRGKILQDNKFRTEQVEQILDAMPEYNNAITALRTQVIRNSSKKTVGIVLDGEASGMRQLKLFVENLSKIDTFANVTIGAGKNIGDGTIGYTLNISYGDMANER